MNITQRHAIYIFMGSKNKYFIAVYTNECKDYCDEKFFGNLLKIKGDNYLSVVDNTKGDKYFKRLKELLPNETVTKLDVSPDPKETLFQRNVTESVNLLRDEFLKSDKDYFLIIESDIIPPKNFLSLFKEAIEKLKDENWGIIGGLYYDGFHDFTLKGIQKKSHILSGCTIYKRELIEKYKFRYDPDNLGPFPDAWICVDSGKEYSLWDNHDIVCTHEHTAHGTRISKPIWTKD